MSTVLPMPKDSPPPDDAIVESPTTAGAAVENLSQWQLIGRRFSRHRLAVLALRVLAILYVVALLAEFFAPYSASWKDLPHAYCPPQPPRWSWQHGLHVYAVEQHVDPVTFRKTYVEDAGQVVPLGFFVRGEPYKLWGLIPAQRRFFGVDMDKWQERRGEAGPAMGSSAEAEQERHAPATQGQDAHAHEV